jgi:hypothetical protein
MSYVARDTHPPKNMNQPTDNRDPWEVKAIGIFFLVAAMIFLFQDGEKIVTHFATGGASGRQPKGYVEVQTQEVARVYGFISLGLGCICLRLYYKLRQGPQKGPKKR